MRHCPPIILNKIYWYRWRHLQSILCKEYHLNFSFVEPLNRLHRNRFNNYGIEPYYVINYRDGHRYYENIHSFIYGWGENQWFGDIVAKLPTNYFYNNLYQSK
jgi:hypothetical protein